MMAWPVQGCAKGGCREERKIQRKKELGRMREMMYPLFEEVQPEGNGKHPDKKRSGPCR